MSLAGLMIGDEIAAELNPRDNTLAGPAAREKSCPSRQQFVPGGGARLAGAERGIAAPGAHLQADRHVFSKMPYAFYGNSGTNLSQCRRPRFAHLQSDRARIGPVIS